MAIPSFSSTVVARAAAAIYGLQLGNGTMSWVLDEANSTAGGVSALVNAVYSRDFASVSNADVAAMVVSNLGITGAGTSDAVAYVKGKLDAAAAGAKGMAIVDAATLFAGLGTHAVYGAAATAFNDRIGSAVAYAQQGGSVDRAFSAGSTISMTLGQDFLTGTAGNDTIIARIVGTANSLQSGDWVDGGTGADRLEADMGSDQAFAVTPETVNVETFVVRGQARAFDSGDNNVSGEGRVLVDAQRLNGVTRFDSNDSRADVIIEDVRTSLRTKDITIGMIGTDAGNVDYAVYFDRLRADGTSTATLKIELMDTRAATSTVDADRAKPLKDSPFNGFSFVVNGKTILLQDPAGVATDAPGTFNAAQDYDELLAAVNKLINDNKATYPELNSITASLTSLGAANGGFDATDTDSKITAEGRAIVLTGSSSASLKLEPGKFLVPIDGVPGSSGLHTKQTPATSTSNDLVTSTVVLDNVGRGSNGGDLVIGAMSVGETSTSAGINRFEITVENSSALGIIASTNNALKEVTVANGTVKGNLRVQGYDLVTQLFPGDERGVSASSGGSSTSGGTGSAQGAVAQHNSYGFNDVRLIDMSKMEGTVSFDAAVTANSFSKYILMSDTQSDPKGDNNSSDGKTTLQVADFDYSGGTKNDTIAVVVDDAIASSNSRVQVGREDFTFVVNGNAGDDAISFVIGAVNYDADDSIEGSDGDTDTTGAENDDNDYLDGGLANWYEHQKLNRNITINGGDGNDTIRTPGSGDMTLTGGTGDDTFYTDNTGTQNTDNVRYRNEGRAVWVFNSDDQVTALAADRDINDIESDRNDNWFMYKAELTVWYRGAVDLGFAVDALQSISVPIGFSATTYLSSDLHINQAIKAAINNDPVLKKLLVAEDGPANSLVVRALVDGVHTADDLAIDVTLPAVNKLTDSEAKKVATAWRGLATVAVGTDVWDALDTLIDGGDEAADLVDFMNNVDGLTDAPAAFLYDNFHDGNGFADPVGSQGYGSALAVADADDDADPLTPPVPTDITGANSTGTTTDNNIEGGAGNDVITLSTTDDTDDGDDGSAALEAVDRLLDSNETVKYTAAFGNDTIVNFEASEVDAYLTDGADVLDLTALGGFGSVGIAQFVDTEIDDGDIGDAPDGQIIVNSELDDDLFDDIDVAYVESLFDSNDLDVDAGDVDNDGDVTEDLEQETFVYIAVDSHNVGHVYSVVDKDGDGDVTASFMGTIDLSDTDWMDLLDSNFAG